MQARHSFPLAALVFVSLLASGGAQAAMYKWTDDQGNVIYSQTPPPDRAATTIAPPPPPPENPYAPAKAESEGDAAAKAQDDPAAKAGKEIERVAKQNCEIAKKNLEIYKNFNRISNEKGEVTVLDDKTRAAKIKQEEQNIKTFCK